ncbi:MAG: sulfotransferase domain-containing protein [Bacteroidota bacterium]|nr:sulfotransferase domain-containing protein [Bacteroidota bacterium]
MKLWRNLKDIVLAFYLPKGDHYLISFPKTGRTWLMYMLRSMLNQLNKDSFINLESTHDSSEIVIEDGSRIDPELVFRYNDRLRYLRSNIIFMVRDPRDVIVSHFHQITKRTHNPLVFDNISEFIRDEKLGFKRIIHFYNLWFRNKDYTMGFLLIRYEDLLNDGINELNKILTFLNIDISEDDVKTIYDNSSADKMRQLEKSKSLKEFNYFGDTVNHLKVRKAKIGSYKDELSEEDILYCNTEMKGLSIYFNYKI